MYLVAFHACILQPSLTDSSASEELIQIPRAGRQCVGFDQFICSYAQHSLSSFLLLFLSRKIIYSKTRTYYSVMLSNL